MGVWSSVTGALDHAAGSFDESIGRQFDDTPGGGFADADTWTEWEPTGWAGYAVRGVAETMARPLVEDEDALDQAMEGGLISVDPENTTGLPAELIATTGETFDSDPGGGWTDPATYDNDDPTDQPSALRQIAEFLQLITTNIDTVVLGVVGLVVIYVFGNLFTINVGDSTG